MLKAGGYGVYVPHELTWEYEREEAPKDHSRFYQVEDLAKLQNLIENIKVKNSDEHKLYTN
jgi:putative hydrolase of the HAD superfamily